MWHASQDFRFNTRLMRVDVENQWTAIWEYGGVSCASATAAQAQPGTAWRQCTPGTTPSDGPPSALPVADLCCKSLGEVFF